MNDYVKQALWVSTSPLYESENQQCPLGTGSRGRVGGSRASQLLGCGARGEGRVVEGRGLQAVRAARGQGTALPRGFGLWLGWGAGKAGVRALRVTDLGLGFPSPALTRSVPGRKRPPRGGGGCGRGPRCLRRWGTRAPLGGRVSARLEETAAEDASSFVLFLPHPRAGRGSSDTWPRGVSARSRPGRDPSPEPGDLAATPGRPHAPRAPPPPTTWLP